MNIIKDIFNTFNELKPDDAALVDIQTTGIKYFKLTRTVPKAVVGELEYPAVTKTLLHIAVPHEKHLTVTTAPAFETEYVYSRKYVSGKSIGFKRIIKKQLEESSEYIIGLDARRKRELSKQWERIAKINTFNSRVKSVQVEYDHESVFVDLNGVRFPVNIEEETVNLFSGSGMTPVTIPIDLLGEINSYLSLKSAMEGQ